MAMTFESAVRKSIRKFQDGESMGELSKTMELKYTKEYFDNAEQELVPTKKVKNGSKS